MLHVSVPAGEHLWLEHLVLDVNGTLTDRGRPIEPAGGCSPRLAMSWRCSVRSQIEASSVLALVAALDARDSYSAEHSEALVELTQGVARRLGLDEEQASEVKWMALLHDIGKVGVPDAVLLKPAPLDESECGWRWESPHRRGRADAPTRPSARDRQGSPEP